jgi:hypothetical protein
VFAFKFALQIQAYPGLLKPAILGPVAVERGRERAIGFVVKYPVAIQHAIVTGFSPLPGHENFFTVIIENRDTFKDFISADHRYSLLATCCDHQCYRENNTDNLLSNNHLTGFTGFLYR